MRMMSRFLLTILILDAQVINWRGILISTLKSIKMEIQIDKIYECNREIGEILQEARTKKNIPLSTCAKVIGTSRRRYASMEQGEAMIGIAEMEVLMDFL
jgi:hypothetical protein